MSPRPLEPQPSVFDTELALAREGRVAEAVHGLIGTLAGGTLHEQHRAAATSVLARIARIAEQAGDHASALLAHDQAVRIAPGYPDIHFQRALVQLTLHQHAAARRSLETALEINPRYVAARLELALLDAREGLIGEALETLRRMGEELRIEQPRAFRQGLESLEHADWDQAGTLLKRALKLSDPGVDEVVEQCHASMAQGDRPAAIRLLRETLTHYEDYADLHFLLGSAELEEGDFDDALTSLARALELHPDYHAARVQFARALEALGDVTQAAEQVALVLQHDPNHPQASQLEERWARRRSRRRRPAGEAGKLA